MCKEPRGNLAYPIKLIHNKVEKNQCLGRESTGRPEKEIFECFQLFTKFALVVSIFRTRLPNSIIPPPSGIKPRTRARKAPAFPIFRPYHGVMFRWIFRPLIVLVLVGLGSAIYFTVKRSSSSNLGLAGSLLGAVDERNLPARFSALQNALLSTGRCQVRFGLLQVLNLETQELRPDASTYFPFAQFFTPHGGGNLRLVCSDHTGNSLLIEHPPKTAEFLAKINRVPRQPLLLTIVEGIGTITANGTELSLPTQLGNLYLKFNGATTVHFFVSKEDPSLKLNVLSGDLSLSLAPVKYPSLGVKVKVVQVISKQEAVFRWQDGTVSKGDLRLDLFPSGPIVSKFR